VTQKRRKKKDLLLLSNHDLLDEKHLEPGHIKVRSFTKVLRLNHVLDKH